MAAAAGELLPAELHVPPQEATYLRATFCRQGSLEVKRGLQEKRREATELEAGPSAPRLPVLLRRPPADHSLPAGGPRLTRPGPASAQR